MKKFPMTKDEVKQCYIEMRLANPHVKHNQRIWGYKGAYGTEACVAGFLAQHPDIKDRLEIELRLRNGYGAAQWWNKKYHAWQDCLTFSRSISEEFSFTLGIDKDFFFKLFIGGKVRADSWKAEADRLVEEQQKAD